MRGDSEYDGSSAAAALGKRLDRAGEAIAEARHGRDPSEPSGVSPRSLRREAIWTERLLSSTARPGHAISMRSDLDRLSPGLFTNSVSSRSPR